jgi:hypothetical protein
MIEDLHTLQELQGRPLLMPSALGVRCLALFGLSSCLISLQVMLLLVVHNGYLLQGRRILMARGAREDTMPGKHDTLSLSAWM